MKKTVKKFGMVLSLAACMGMMMTGCGGNDAAQTGGEASGMQNKKTRRKRMTFFMHFLRKGQSVFLIILQNADFYKNKERN